MKCKYVQLTWLKPRGGGGFRGNSEPQKTGGAGKAWCSVALPGLGQFLDGRKEKGFQFLGTALGLSAIGAYINRNVYKALFSGNIERLAEEVSKPITKGKLGGAIVLCAAGLTNYICNIVDAYKGNKKNAVTENEQPKADKTETAK